MARSVNLVSLALVVLFLSRSFVEVAEAGTGPGRWLVVSWNDTTAIKGFVQAIEAEAPWNVITPPIEVGMNAVVRSAGGMVYVVNSELGTILVVDPGTWSVVNAYDLGPTSAPVDIAVISPSVAFVTRSQGTHMLRFDLNDGTATDSVDLRVFADADGIPDMNMMIVHESRLFVQIRREIGQSGSFAPPFYLAVVDLATEQLLDVDPVTPGNQAIELQGTAPKLKMKIVPGTRQLLLSATGEFFDAGGIELVDLDSLQSLGLVASEVDDLLGADLGPFTMVTDDAGYLAFSTDLAISTHVLSFSVAGGVDTVPTIYDDVGYFAPVLEFDPGSNALFVPQGFGDTGIHVFDATTGTRLTVDPIALGGPPADMAFLCSGFGDCESSGAVPTASKWGLAVIALLITVLGTLVIRRSYPRA